MVTTILKMMVIMRMRITTLVLVMVKTRENDDNGKRYNFIEFVT